MIANNRTTEADIAYAVFATAGRINRILEECGAAPLPRTTWEEWKRATGKSFYNTEQWELPSPARTSCAFPAFIQEDCDNSGPHCGLVFAFGGRELFLNAMRAAAEAGSQLADSLVRIVKNGAETTAKLDGARRRVSLALDLAFARGLQGKTTTSRWDTTSAEDAADLADLADNCAYSEAGAFKLGVATDLFGADVMMGVFRALTCDGTDYQRVDLAIQVLLASAMSWEAARRTTGHKPSDEAVLRVGALFARAFTSVFQGIGEQWHASVKDSDYVSINARAAQRIAIAVASSAGPDGLLAAMDDDSAPAFKAAVHAASPVIAGLIAEALSNETAHEYTATVQRTASTGPRAVLRLWSADSHELIAPETNAADEQETGCELPVVDCSMREPAVPAPHGGGMFQREAWAVAASVFASDVPHWIRNVDEVEGAADWYCGDYNPPTTPEDEAVVRGSAMNDFTRFHREIVRALTLLKNREADHGEQWRGLEEGTWLDAASGLFNGGEYADAFTVNGEGKRTTGAVVALMAALADSTEDPYVVRFAKDAMESVIAASGEEDSLRSSWTDRASVMYDSGSTGILHAVAEPERCENILIDGKHDPKVYHDADEQSHRRLNRLVRTASKKRYSPEFNEERIVKQYQRLHPSSPVLQAGDLTVCFLSSTEDMGADFDYLASAAFTHAAEEWRIVDEAEEEGDGAANMLQNLVARLVTENICGLARIPGGRAMVEGITADEAVKRAEALTRWAFRAAAKTTANRTGRIVRISCDGRLRKAVIMGPGTVLATRAIPAE